jgi:serine/threonine protein phosphatase 1
MRTIFIGDVHGCVRELQALVQKLQLREDDVLVFVGDLLHKGPDSEGVFEYVLQLQNNYQVEFICGNHEEKHLRWLRGEQRRLLTGAPNKMQHVEEYPAIKITDAAWELMNRSYIAKQYGSITAVHAGIPGNLRALEYLTHDEWLKASSRSRDALGQIMRVRFLAGPGRTRINSKGKIKEIAEGTMLALGENQPGDPYWADVYDGRFGNIVFGHNPFMQSEPKKFDHAYGIDLGCVHGGYLCALISEGDSISHTVVQAERVYKPRPSWVYDLKEAT